MQIEKKYKLRIHRMELVKYTSLHRTECLQLFDLNCPEFFAPNERSYYETYLDCTHEGYRAAILDHKVVAAFGVRVFPLPVVNYRHA